jgi:hypothetical protein
MTESWYRTPLDFVGRDHFGINAHWRYYTVLAEKIHIPINRPMRSLPWDRFPSDEWLSPDIRWALVAALPLLGFSITLLLGWNFYFPTTIEKFLWRVCSAYHAFFSIFGMIYYCIEMVKSDRLRKPKRGRRQVFAPFSSIRCVCYVC